MAEETTGQPEPGSRMRRAPLRAWLVSGPVGRLVGFCLDFAKALREHHRSRR